MLQSRINAQGAKRMMRRLFHNATHTTPLMREISEDMRGAVEDNFAQQGRPKKWAPLSPTTIARRPKNAKGNPILRVSDHLASSHEPSYTRTTAIVGTNTIYAGTHKYGAKKGSYGKTKHGAPIPWGDIPARDFQNLTKQDIDGYERKIERYLTRGVKF